jgi:3-oxoacyl-[acyl-carrier-protein] synthase III
MVSTHLHADGAYKDLLYCPTGVSRGMRPVGGANSHPDEGNEVFKVAVNTLGRIVDETLAANGLTSPTSTGWCRTRPTSASSRRPPRKLDMPMERVMLTVQDHGNTSAASVPMALDVAVRDGRIKPGDLLLLEAFGGGFTWGSALVRW